MSTYTQSKNIPWKPAPFENVDWQGTWPELKCSSIDPIEVVGDLYLLEGLAAHGFVHNYVKPTALHTMDPARLTEIEVLLNLSDNDRKIRAERVGNINSPLQVMAQVSDGAAKLQLELIDSVVDTFWAYTHAACGGELRHHPSVGNGPLPGLRKAAWCHWRTIYEEHGIAALELMSKLFLEMKGGGIGGKRWAAATDILIAYEKGQLGPTTESNRKIFVDRVLALQHNGGCFLSKRQWHGGDRMKRPDAKAYGKDGHPWSAQSLNPNHQSMVPVLDSHAASPPNIDGLYICASNNVQALTLKYLKAAEEAGVKINGTWSYGSQPVNPEPAKKEPKLVMTGQKSSSPFVAAEPGSKNTIKVDELDPNKKITVEFRFHTVKLKDGTLVGDETNVLFTTDYMFKDLEEFKNKKFYFGHMLKSKYPGGTAMLVQVRVGQVGSLKWKYTPWAATASAYGLKSKYGVNILTLIKNQEV